MGISDNIICLLRNLCAGQEATGQQVHWWTGSKLGKEYIKATLSSCLFNLYAEYITGNARLDESQAEIKIAGRNINNLWYADDTTLMMESEEELKSLLMRVKDKSEEADLKLNIQKLRSWHLAPLLHCK